MTTQQDTDGNVTWVPPLPDREEPLASAWANVHLSHPQPEHHQSFFADCMDYRAEEAALFIPDRATRGLGTVQHPMNALPTLYAPQAIIEDANIATRLLQTNVDVSQFGPVHQEDWRKASIDFTEDDEDAPSPSLTEATSHGPFTPDGDVGFRDAALVRPSYDLGSSFGSTSTDDLFEGMFQDVKGNNFRAFGPWDVSRNQPTTSTQPLWARARYESNPGGRLAGLPAPGSYTVGINNNGEEASLSQGSFRDVDGLPTPAMIPLPKQKRRTTQAEVETAVVEPTSSRKERDQYLLDMREKGFTYSDIKKSGDFPEAESTLRGRVRVLTKARSERVRKPEWTDRDIRLLRRGVASLLTKPAVSGVNRRRRTGKLPWKEISAYIKSHGGSYTFAPATCAKKWDEVTRDD